jgi:hypothetical protein
MQGSETIDNRGVVFTVDFLCYDIARDNRFIEYRMIGVDFNAYLVSSFVMAYYDILTQREYIDNGILFSAIIQNK